MPLFPTTGKDADVSLLTRISWLNIENAGEVEDFVFATIGLVPVPFNPAGIVSACRTIKTAMGEAAKTNSLTVPLKCFEQIDSHLAALRVQPCLVWDVAAVTGDTINLTHSRVQMGSASEFMANFQIEIFRSLVDAFQRGNAFAFCADCVRPYEVRVQISRQAYCSNRCASRAAMRRKRDRDAVSDLLPKYRVY